MQTSTIPSYYLTVAITFASEAVKKINISMYEPTSLSQLIPSNRQMIQDIKLLIDNHKIILLSPLERLQNIFVAQRGYRIKKK